MLRLACEAIDGSRSNRTKVYKSLVRIQHQHYAQPRLVDRAQLADTALRQGKASMAAYHVARTVRLDFTSDPPPSSSANSQLFLFSRFSGMGFS